MSTDYSEIKDKIRSWWDDPLQDYDAVKEHGVHSELEIKSWREGLNILLGNKQGLKILDVGTGTGFLALLLAEMGHELTGADWSANKLQKAKDKASKSGLNVKFEVEDAEKLSYDDNSFDAVVSRHVLWTLADPRAALNEWARVIKPGGRLIVDVPRMNTHTGDHHFGEEIGRNLPFYRGADPDKVMALLRDVGLEEVSSHLLEASNFHGEATTLLYGTKPH